MDACGTYSIHKLQKTSTFSKTKKTWTSGHLYLLDNAMRWNDVGFDDVSCIEGVPSILARHT